MYVFGFAFGFPFGFPFGFALGTALGFAFGFLLGFPLGFAFGFAFVFEPVAVFSERGMEGGNFPGIRVAAGAATGASSTTEYASLIFLAESLSRNS
ncbi:MAG: hypothetical protein EBT07_15890 [Actinobacteria bacterium]|nr:hypothetical protein [Actinomycetota bacterium]